MRSYCLYLGLCTTILVLCCHLNKQATTGNFKANKKQYLDSLNISLQEIADSSLIPGFAVSLVQDAKILFSKGYGYSNLNSKAPFTTQTINSVASISKTFIGFAILKLVEEGKLTLDEPVNLILPYKIINPFYPDKEITVRHLVTHTSGISQEFDPEDVGEATIILIDSFEVNADTPENLKKEIAYYKLGRNISIDEHIKKFTQPSGKWYTQDNFLKYPPGSKFNYTNLGALIAARIVEIKSGLAFDKYIKGQIFEPLNMKNTAWNYKELDSKLFCTIYTTNDRKNPTKVLEHPRYEMTDYPVGGLKTNVEDLTKYLLEIIKGYNGQSKLLSPESYQLLLNPQLGDSCFEHRNNYVFNDQYNMGVFWSVSAPGYRMHNGGTIGVYSFIYFNPKTGMGALAFCNLPHNDFGKIREMIHKYELLLSE